MIIVVTRRSQCRTIKAGALFHTRILAVRMLTAIVTKRWTAVVGEAPLLLIVEYGANGNLWEEHVISVYQQGPTTCRKNSLAVDMLDVAS